MKNKFMYRAAIVLIMAGNMFTTVAQTSNTKAKPSSPSVSKSGYAPVNGLQLYYEIHGKGEPLVLLHGGLGAIDMFGQHLQTLAKNHQVIAVDLQGHGRTADIDRPLSVEKMADDIAELLKFLKIEKADIVGYSMGGGVGWQVAIKYPERVHKLVAVSTPFKRTAFFRLNQINSYQSGWCLTRPYI